ncbi:MAG TPA: acetyl-CoA carboxylase biotin carboxylase subunit [Candidatus Thermoplasmatota archaeon]|nr:acetyl-CoA carboxylase biotin carboxylase subunit [Candidatus Thermoplasmatota archaeon]
MFRKLLIANRGEIAVRVVRAARELGVATVAVHSEADAGGLWTRMADEAVLLGPAPSRDSYLRADRILEAAERTGAEAIHPGYGFLSENPAFARAVRKAGLAWVGPTPEAMERMGDKTRARAEAEAAGVPVAPGSSTLRDAAHARAEAERIGYPVLLKAAAGGGGIGMRVVHGAGEMEAQLSAAQAQAVSAFGSGDVFLEKFLERPRHIEVQILADQHGNVLHLGERECSIQRRHQKLVEEAPSPALTPVQRADLGAKAVALARRVGYSNAGTLEFLQQDGRFAFNEMNTRLQVEHPVTEMVAGLDIVQWQLRIAAGERLPFRQEDIRATGHAIEVRINAEDPAHGFAPSPGTVRTLRLPSGPGVRVETALEAGRTVPPHYDSLVLKLIVHAADRAGAIARLERALGELHIEGFATNRELHLALATHPAFRRGDLSTRFLEEHGLVGGLERAAAGRTGTRRLRAAALAAVLADAPGGGLAGLAVRQSMPARLAQTSGRRDWGAEGE